LKLGMAKLRCIKNTCLSNNKNVSDSY
jgi:hypothetical protein